MYRCHCAEDEMHKRKEETLWSPQNNIVFVLMIYKSNL